MTSLESITFDPVIMGDTNSCMDTFKARQYSDVDTYVRYGTYNGVKVTDTCKNRMIPKDTDLSQVFEQDNAISVYCFDIYPGSDDILKYQQIMQSVYEGDSFVESLDKHPTDKGFVVMLVINSARMKFRNDDYTNIFPSIGVANE